MHHLPMYRDCPRDELAVAESIERRLVTLQRSEPFRPIGRGEDPMPFRWGIDIHDKDALALLREACSEVDGGGGLAYAALLAGDCDDSSHSLECGGRTSLPTFEGGSWNCVALLRPQNKTRTGVEQAECST